MDRYVGNIQFAAAGRNFDTKAQFHCVQKLNFITALTNKQ